MSSAYCRLYAKLPAPSPPAFLLVLPQPADSQVVAFVWAAANSGGHGGRDLWGRVACGRTRQSVPVGAWAASRCGLPGVGTVTPMRLRRCKGVREASGNI